MKCHYCENEIDEKDKELYMDENRMCEVCCEDRFDGEYDQKN